MNNIIIRLANKCKNISNSKKFLKYNIYNEIIDLILNNKYDEKNAINLLVELYRYCYYSEVRISLDPRSDVNFKSSILIKTKDSLMQNNLTPELIEEFKETNDFMRKFIDSPIEFIESEIKFYSEHPNTRF